MREKNHWIPLAPVRRLAAVSLLLCVFSPLSVASQWHFTDVERVVAVSDIHGAYDAMVATFRRAGVIDENLAWCGETTHLVITGDLLDRGPDSRKVMDLIMRLEGEALAAGGRVHQLIGNHEVMNLVGDLRYVSLSEYAAFADDESEQERERWFQRYQNAQAAEADKLTLQIVFNEMAPPGFFGHRRAFRADGHYGKWLLQKPLMVVIDGTAFVHGGISPFVAEYGLEGVNGFLKDELLQYVTELGALEDQEILSPTDSFYDHPALLKAKIERGLPHGLANTSADVIIELNSSPIHGSNSPLWYRGSVGCNELIESEALDAAFDRIGATRAVIGHTPTISRRILQRMNGRIIEIDTGMLHAAYRGSGNALLIDGDSLRVINESGATYSVPIEHPRRVGQRPTFTTADELENLLSDAAITSSIVDSDGRKRVYIGAGEGAIAAYFIEKPRKRGFQPEVAAYRLDRMLGLDMVPVTVIRKVDGKAGALQFFPASTISEQERAVSGRGTGWCPLNKQWNAMYVFDALIYNVGRNPALMLYSQDDWQLMLFGHEQAFKTSKGRPPYLDKIELDTTKGWVEALGELGDEVLKENLGDVLSKRQLAALGRRRDQLIYDARK